MNEQSQDEWQAPPLPEEIKKTDEAPRMSEVATLGNIFVSPGETFEDLRRKPRFIMAILVMMFLATAFQFLFTQKMGEERMRSFMVEQVNKSPMIQSMPPDQKQQAVENGLKTSAVTKYLIPVFMLIVFAIGGLIYWLGANAMGGSMTFLRGVSVWVYSSFPPAVVSMLASILILFLKSPDDIDIAASQSGLIHANPAFFLNTKTMPVLGALLGTFDLFFIWGWILAAIGLSVAGKISKGAAWAIVLLVALINIAFRVIGAYFSGAAM